MSRQIRTVGVFTGTRAEYGLLYPVIRALLDDPDFEMALYVSGTHLQSAYGKTLQEIESDGVPVQVCFSLSETGNNMVLETGELIRQLGAHFAEIPPDCLIVLGDRYETLAAVTAAFLSNIPVAHLHGGDVVGGGMLDDSIRHAITKLSHLHFPATEASAERILKMGEEPWRITVVGSPTLDNLRMLEPLPKSHFTEWLGLDAEKPWVLFTQHPITTAADEAGEQARQSLSALAGLAQDIEVIATYPNQDAGSARIIEQLARFGELPHFHVVKSLGRVNYLNLLRHVEAVVGNSSSGLLETGHFRVPCLNIGERQHGRERGDNVVNVPQDEAAIRQALARILSDEVYRAKLRDSGHPFGEGRCAETVLAVLRQTPPDKRLLQKQLTY